MKIEAFLISLLLDKSYRMTAALVIYSTLGHKIHEMTSRTIISRDYFKNIYYGRIGGDIRSPPQEGFNSCFP